MPVMSRPRTAAGLLPNKTLTLAFNA